jgi:hypothetical protein
MEGNRQAESSSSSTDVRNQAYVSLTGSGAVGKQIPAYRLAKPVTAG